MGLDEARRAADDVGVELIDGCEISTRIPEGSVHVLAYGFDPDDALERSRWEMGTVEEDRAEVLITHRGADRPAVLRMFREGGRWKVGLVETFWEH